MEEPFDGSCFAKLAQKVTNSKQKEFKSVRILVGATRLDENKVFQTEVNVRA